MASSFAVKIPIRAIDRLSTPLKKMNGRIGVFSKQTQKRLRGINKITQRSSQSFGGLGKKLLGFAGAYVGLRAISSGLKNIVSEGANFEAKMDGITAKFGGMAKLGVENFERLKEAAKNVGATTEWSAQQAAEGLDFLAMAGFSAEQAIASLPGVVDLATASNLDLGRATDIASDALGMFNLMTDDSDKLQQNLGRVTDVLAKTTTSSNTSMDILFETLKKVGPVATSSGASIETTAAMAGVLASAGIKGSEAGTALKNVFTNLVKNEQKIKKLGVSVANSDGSFRDMFDILGDLEPKLAAMTEKERAATVEKIFGMRALGAVNILLDKGSDGLKDYRSELENSQEATALMAAEMRDNLLGKYKELKSSISDVVLTLYEALKPSLETVTDLITGAVRGIGKWVKANEDLIQTKITDAINKTVDGITKFYDIFTKLYPFLRIAAPIFIGIAGAVKILTLAQAAYNAVALMNPTTWLILLIIAGVAALTLGVIWLAKNWETVKRKAFEFGSTVGKAVKDALDWLKRIGSGLKSLFTSDWGTIGFFSKLSDGWESVKSAVSSFKDFTIGVLRQIGGFIFDVLTAPLKTVLQVASKLPGTSWADNALASIEGLSSKISGEDSSKGMYVVGGPSPSYMVDVSISDNTSEKFSVEKKEKIVNKTSGNLAYQQYGGY